MNEHDRGYPGWRVMWACAAAAFFASTPYQVFAVFLLPVSEEFSWSRESASGAYAVMAVSAAAAAPLVGRLIDRIGARPVIVLSMIVVGLAVSSLSMLTASLAHLYGVSIAIGVATIGASAVAHSRVIFGWFDVHRGRALGLMLAGGMVSAIVLPPAAVNLIRAFGWRAAWVVLGMLIVVVGVSLVSRFLQERTAMSDAESAMVQGASVAEALRSRLLWTLMATIFGAAMMVSGAIVHTSALL